MHNSTETPTLFRTIIALFKFDDVPPFPAVGYVSKTSDTEELYFACFVPRTGYAWNLVVKWDYLDEVCKGYSVPIKGDME